MGETAYVKKATGRHADRGSGDVDKMTCPPHRYLITTEIQELSPYLRGVCHWCGEQRRYQKAPHLDRKPWINWAVEKAGRAAQL